MKAMAPEGGQESHPVDGGPYHGIDHHTYKEVEGHIDGVHKGLLFGFQVLNCGQHNRDRGKKEKPRGRSTGKIQKPSRFRNRRVRAGVTRLDDQKGPVSSDLIADGSCKKGSHGSGKLNDGQGQFRIVQGISGGS